MVTIRPAGERGHFDHGWLNTWHSFSFADYYDPRHMGFRNLRVINEDTVAPQRGFGMHPHRDMEIVTYVLQGALAHQDSMGNGSVIRRGEVQRMSAGTGILHSEVNPSQSEPVHLLQIWLLPQRRGLKPSYEQKTIPDEEKRGKLCAIASAEGNNGSVRIHQDAAIYAALLASGVSATHPLRAGSGAWLQVISGAVELNGKLLNAGDGASIEEETELRLTGRDASRESELLLFEL
jgi:redox-sensitive bicupin YhaK (pirin superfamily)